MTTIKVYAEDPVVRYLLSGIFGLLSALFFQQVAYRNTEPKSHYRLLYIALTLVGLSLGFFLLSILEEMRVF